MIVKKSVPVAPDGGWGYLVALGLTLFLGTTSVPLQSCFSIVFGNFLTEVGDGPSSVTMITTIFCIVGTFIGIFSNPLIQKYTLRQISFFGTMTFMTGSIGNIFVTKVWHLVITFGIFQGIGFGVMLPCVLTSFNNYFEKKRAFMNSLALVGLCPIYILLPVCFQYFMEEYGFRGTIALLTAFTANIFICVAVMSPVENHCTFKTDIELITVSINGTSVESDHVENTNKIFDENTPLNTENPELQEPVNGKLRLTDKSNEKSGLWNQIINILDLTLLHEWRYINLITGIAIFLYLEVHFLTVGPMFLIRRGFDPDQVAICLTAGGIGDLFGRSSLTLLSGFIRFRFWYLVFVSSILMFTFRNVFVLDLSYPLMVALFFSAGFVRSYMHTPIPILFTERYSIERFPAAWGLYSVGCGFANIFLGVLISSVADYFQNDTYTMHAFSATSLFWILTWFIEMCADMRQNKL